MDDTVFIFAVVPAFFGFVGFMAALVFGPGIIRHYNALLAAQRQRQARPAPVATLAGREFVEAAPRNRERELVLN
jgi:hypothetical protein